MLVSIIAVPGTTGVARVTLSDLMNDSKCLTISSIDALLVAKMFSTTCTLETGSKHVKQN
jgi:hypothetical protein